MCYEPRKSLAFGRRMLDWLWRKGRVGARAAWRAGEKLTYDGGLAIASNVALSLLLSLFPFLMLVAGLVRYFGGAELTESVVGLVLDTWPAGSAEAVSQAIRRAIANDGSSFFSYSTIVALILASNGVENARDGLNRAYKVAETRSFLWRRVQAVLVVVIGAMGLILAALVLVGAPLINEYLRRADAIADPRVHFLLRLGRYLVGAVILAIILWPFHRYLPDGSRRERRMWPGILTTIAGVILGSELFALYLNYNANYTALYAGLAGIMVAIVYLYCVAALLLYGAELNQTLMEMERERAAAREASRHRRRRRPRSEVADA